MKYTVDEIKTGLAEIEQQMSDVNKRIERKKHVLMQSEVEPGTTHKVLLDDKEFRRAAGELLQKWHELKADRETLERLLADHERNDAAEVARKDNSSSSSESEYVYDLRPPNDPNKPQPKYEPTNSSEWDLALDHKSLASRRGARLEKIAECMCGDMKADDDADYMAHQNVATILEQAIFVAKKVASHVEGGHKLEDWLEDKISKVADDMDEIYKYMKNDRE